jgi:hypothetical protein
MMTTDGRYITLAELKTFMFGNIADPADTTKYSGVVTTTPDDSILTSAILRAEAKFDAETSTRWDSTTSTLAQPIQIFVDGNGWIHLFAREAGPVTAVSALQMRNLAAGTSWETITWGADDIILPPLLDPPTANSKHVMIYPGTVMGGTGTGNVFGRWTYTGGYSTIPGSLKSIILRLAQWIYKLREAPLGVVKNPMLGSIDIPQKVPPDVQRDIELWMPRYS